jgi:hypothetical protein
VAALDVLHHALAFGVIHHRFAALSCKVSFTRLFTLVRSALWQKLDLSSLLDCYGTASGGGHFYGTPEQAYLPNLT